MARRSGGSVLAPKGTLVELVEKEAKQTPTEAVDAALIELGVRGSFTRKEVMNWLLDIRLALEGSGLTITTGSGAVVLTPVTLPAR